MEVRGNLKVELGLLSDSMFVVFIGNICFVKGYEYFVEVVLSLVERD